MSATPSFARPADREKALPALIGPDGFASTIFLWAAALFDHEFFEAPPEGQRLSVAKALKLPADAVPDAAMDRLRVAIDLATSNRFYGEVRTFIDWCNVLGGSALSAQFDPADVAECAWGVFEAELIHPPENGFGVDVREYVRVVLDEEGYGKIPKALAPVGVKAKDGLPGGMPDLAGAAMAAQKGQADLIDASVTGDAEDLFRDLTLVLSDRPLARVKDRLSRMVTRVRPPHSPGQAGL